MPSGGAGLYFFHTDMWVTGTEHALFIIRMNGAAICKTEADTTLTGDTTDDHPATCGGVSLVVEGTSKQKLIFYWRKHQIRIPAALKYGL